MQKWSGVMAGTDILKMTRTDTAIQTEEASTIEEFVEVLQNVDIAKYTLVATCLLFVYDYLLTLDEEVFLVWPSRFGVPKALFFLNRYFPFVDLALLVVVQMFGSDPSLCVKMFQGAGSTIAFGFVVAELILTMRTLAIWARQTAVTVLLALLITTALGVDIYVLLRYLGGVSFTQLGSLGILYKGCPLTFANRFVFVDFVVVMVTESVMLLLLVIKAAEHFKHSRSTLMVQMFKDGIIYFVFILVTSIANVVVILVTPIEIHNFLIITQRILHSIFCSRVLLHIRGAYAYTNAGMHSATITAASQLRSSAQYEFRHWRVSGRGSGGFHGESHSRDTYELVTVDARTRDSVAGIHGWGMGHGYDGDGPVISSDRGWDKAPSPLSPASSPFSPVGFVPPWLTRTEDT